MENNAHKRQAVDFPSESNKKQKIELPIVTIISTDENINEILPVERLLDILLICKDMEGLLRVVCSHWKNIIDSQYETMPLKKSLKKPPKPTTLKYLFFSSLTSYVWAQKQTHLTPRDLCKAIRERTLSIDVAQIVFQTTLVTNKVLFALGETGSIDLLNVLAKDWPFVKAPRSAEKDWQSFVTFALVSYPDNVLEWIKDNQHLFFHRYNLTDEEFNQKFITNCSTNLAKDSKTFTKFSFTSVTKFFHCYDLFPEIGNHTLSLKFPTLLDFIDVFNKGKDLVFNQSVDIGVTIQHITKNGRLNYVSDWDDLSDEQKIQRLECFVIQLKTLCQCFPHYKNTLSKVVKRTMASLFFPDFYKNNWIKGLNWMIDNDFITEFILDDYHPITKEVIELFILKFNNGCQKLNRFLRSRHLIPRLLVSQDVNLFQTFVLDKFTATEMNEARYFLLPDLIPLHSVVGKWLLKNHLYDFIQLFLAVIEDYEENRISQFLQTFEPLFAEGSQITDDQYQKIVYWVHVARRRQFYFTDETPPPECHIAVNIAHGLYGDHEQHKDLHTWLFDQFKPEPNLNLKKFHFKRKSDFNWEFKDFYHFKSMYPILEKYINKKIIISSARSLHPSEYKDFFNFLKSQKIRLNRAQNLRLPRQIYYCDYYTTLKHDFGTPPHYTTRHKYIKSLIQNNQLSKYLKPNEQPENDTNSIRDLINVCTAKGNIHHIVQLFEYKIVDHKYFPKSIKIF